MRWLRADHADPVLTVCVLNGVLTVLTMRWCPVDKVEANSGGMRYIRGSHRWAEHAPSQLITNAAIDDRARYATIPSPGTTRRSTINEGWAIRFRQRICTMHPMHGVYV